MHRRRRALMVTACAVILLVSLVAVWLWEPPTPCAPVVTTNPLALEYPSTPWLDRIPRGWSWAWRFRDKVFPRKVITLDSRIVALDRMAGDLQAALPSPTPGPWESDGIKLWLFGKAEQARLLEVLEGQESKVVSAPRVTTGDHIQAGIITGVPTLVRGGSAFAGTEISVHPRILTAGTDLTLVLTVTEAVTNSQPDGLFFPGERSDDVGGGDNTQAGTAIDSGIAVEVVSLRTNLVLGLRALVPRQGGLLVLRRGATNSAETSHMLLISVDVPAHRQ